MNNPNPEKPNCSLDSFHDSILCHILTFMPTKYAARTSILSKRWKYLFLDVPKLAFSDEDVSNHGTFTEFVNRRLMLCKTHTSSIAEFRLALQKLPKHSVINLWIVTSLSRNLKVLEIRETHCGDGTPQCPPREIFGWVTLEVLKLRGKSMVLKFPKSVIFPNLRELHLEYLEIQTESESLRFDQPGYPLLQKLQLRKVSFKCSKDINEAFLGIGIFLCTLETLELQICGAKLVRNIDIDTPSLRQIKYNNWEVDNVTPVLLSFCKSEYLMSAHLYSKFNRRDLHNKLLSKTTGVKDLSLFKFDAQDLTYSLPHFANLTHLTLLNTGVEPMLSVLQSAPRLEVLIHNMLAKDVNFVPPTDVPLCLAQKLTKITLSDFVRGKFCTEKDVGLVRYFLQHGAVLERLILKHPTPVTQEWRLSTFEQILNLPRRSPKCEIEVSKRPCLLCVVSR